MKGRITEYNPAEAKGTIAAFNTMRYGFSRADWIDNGEPAVGQDVEFRIDEKAARDIVLRRHGASQFHRERLATVRTEELSSEATTGMTFGEAVRTCFNKYAEFSGRARRSEYWWFALFGFLAQMAALFIETSAHVGYLTDLLDLALFLPSFSVGVRRLHDIDRSGWWIGIFWIAWLTFGVAAGLFLFSGNFAASVATGTAAGYVFAIAGGVFALVMFPYGITLFVFSVLQGTDGPNEYGPDPLANVDPVVTPIAP